MRPWALAVKRRLDLSEMRPLRRSAKHPWALFARPPWDPSEMHPSRRSAKHPWVLCAKPQWALSVKRRSDPYKIYRHYREFLQALAYQPHPLRL